MIAVRSTVAALFPVLHFASKPVQSVYMKQFLPLMFLLVSCASTDEKKTDYSITFHTIASDMDPPKTMFPFDLNGKRMLFKIVPEFSQQNVIAFHPFPSTTGDGNGAVLQLDFRGKSQLEIISRTRRDEYLLTMVDAKPVDFLVLDQPVTDGMVTVWQGLPAEVIAKMDKKIQRMSKGGQAPSMSENMEMRPTTRGDKIRSYEAAKAHERDAAAGKLPKKKEVQSLTLPEAPVTPKIPVEGATPPLPPIPPSPGSTLRPPGAEPRLPQP